MNKLHIIIDYDSTIANSQKAICDMYNSKFSPSGEEVANWRKVKKWNMECQCPLIYKDGESVLDYFADPVFFDVVEYFDGAQSTLDSWNEKGYEITICTAGCADNIHNKIPTLDKDFPYANLVPVTMRGSNGVGKSIINMERAIFIDDHKDNLLTSNAACKILYKDESIHPDVWWAQLTSEEKEEHNIIEVNSWRELGGVIHLINKFLRAYNLI